jgi:diguanylate cyclase (GGDEF)-like protein
MIAALLIFILIAVSLYSFRQFAINSAQNHSKTLSEVIRTTLTEAMVNGVIDKRASLLDRMGKIEGLVSARVIRSPHVSEQFGEGLAQEENHDAIELDVINSGETHFSIQEDGLQPVFRSTIPFIASASGDPNCLQCHKVNDGTVLGAVSIVTTADHLQSDAFTSILVLIGSITVFAILSVFFLHKLIQPLIQTAGLVQCVTAKAVNGDFTGKIAETRNDEIGQIAKDLNKLIDYLNSGLNHIQQDVAQLIQASPEKTGNLLDDTTSMVGGLIDAAHFKQAIEEDETTMEVYQRLSKLLQVDFGIATYSIYEVDSDKNQMKSIIVDGEETADCKWCNSDILIRAQGCRVRRTGHIINGFESPGICNAFKSDNDNIRHVCLPVIQSGTVGSVIQIVDDAKRIQMLCNELAYLQVYLREAAPVIQSKRLMDKLHQSTLRDPMTGLHNRRFLEEYVDTLVSSTVRRKAHFTILMADLDYFKKVNDELGHDAGDTVLKELSKTLVSSVRASDMVIRFGGEEFLIILKETGKEDAINVAENIRKSVEEMKVQINGKVLQKTLSIGLADFPLDSDTFWQTMKFADVALYSAKESGRNKVVAFTSELWQNDEHY